MDGWMDDGWMDRWVDGQMSGWIDGWMDDGWTDGWMGSRWVAQCIDTPIQIQRWVDGNGQIIVRYNNGLMDDEWKD